MNLFNFDKITDNVDLIKSLDLVDARFAIFGVRIVKEMKNYCNTLGSHLAICSKYSQIYRKVSQEFKSKFKISMRPLDLNGDYFSIPVSYLHEYQNKVEARINEIMHITNSYKVLLNAQIKKVREYFKKKNLKKIDAKNIPEYEPD